MYQRIYDLFMVTGILFWSVLIGYVLYHVVTPRQARYTDRGMMLPRKR